MDTSGKQKTGKTIGNMETIGREGDERDGLDVGTGHKTHQKSRGVEGSSVGLMCSTRQRIKEEEV